MREIKDRLIDWIRQRQTVVEKVICSSIEAYVNDKVGKKNFLFDQHRCQQESFRLSGELDLCYDRPTIGLTYASWYLGSRINTSLDLIIDSVIESTLDKKDINIFDLGAGTGAVQFAVYICLSGLHSMGYKIPKVQVVNVDISPFMLDYSLTYIMPNLIKEFGFIDNFIHKYSTNSWASRDNFAITAPWIVSSYLFDHTEDVDEMQKVFNEFIQKYKPLQVFFCTSGQAHKKDILRNLVSKVKSNSNYEISVIPSLRILVGDMHKLNSLRRNLQENQQIITTSNNAYWSESNFFGVKMVSRISEMSFDLNVDAVNVFTPSVQVKSEIILNDVQKDAAKIDGRPTIVTGPAGSGKSVVLMNRLKNIVEAHGYNPNLKILVTTFNIGLIDSLKNWVQELLDKDKIKAVENGFQIKGSNLLVNIAISNFDKLPKRISKLTSNAYSFKVKDDIVDENKYFDKVGEAIQFLKSKNIGFNEVDTKYFEPKFLKDEFERVIYGQQLTKDQYLAATRSSRPYSLRYNSLERECIYDVLALVHVEMRRENKATFYTRRQALLNLLRQSNEGFFDYVIVDEFQDCTYADYQIFYGLLKDVNNIVIGGDLAQAVHLGKSANIPKADEEFANDQRMKNFNRKVLSGSYRLPFRIANCVKPLSYHISKTQKDIDLISAYKGAPPGARPIIVYGENIESIGSKIAWIIDWYEAYFNRNEEKKITILERDSQLSKFLNKWSKERFGKYIAETDSILKLKGLEKGFVVWSATMEIDDIDDVYHYIYTILTRTFKLLVIALSDDIPLYVDEVFKLMKDNGDFIVWDKETEEFLRKRDLLCNAY